MYLFFLYIVFFGLMHLLKSIFLFSYTLGFYFFEYGVGVGLMPLFRCIYLFFYISFLWTYASS